MISRSGLTRLVLALGLLLTATSALAQRYHVHTYGVNEGLPNAFINSITQDELGRIWLGTRTGVVVYDGTTWEHFGLESGLTNPDVAHVRTDGQGRIWTLGANPWSPTHVFDGSEWRAISAPADANHEFSILTAEVVTVEDEPVLMVGTDEGDLFALQNETWTNLSLPEIRPGYDIVAVRQVHGDVLVCAEDRILQVIPAGESFRTETRVIADDDRLRAMVHDPDRGETWVVGDRRIYRLLGNELVDEAAAPRLQVNAAWPLHHRSVPDGVGGFIFAALESAVRYHPDTGAQEFGIAQGLGSEGATDFLLDQEGNIWVTSLRGVSKVVSLALASYDHEFNLLEDEVSAILQRDDGSVVLGHPQGLSFWPGSKPSDRLELPVTSTSSRVLDLYQDPEGVMWAACAESGLLRFGKDGSRRRFLQESHVNGVLQDGKGRLWASSADELFYFEDGRFRALGADTALGISSLYTRRLFPSRDGGIYAATARYGLLKIDTDLSVNWTPVQRGAPGVYSMLERDNGDLWIGCGDGLWLVRGTQAHRMDPSFGGPRLDRSIYFLTDHPNGDVWIGTDNGVVRWDGEHATTITMRDGLAGSETNRAAGIVDDLGRVWIGTSGGLSIYDPRHEPRRKVGPRARFRSVLVDDESPVPVDDEIKLSHDQNSLTFKFRAMSFLDESRITVESWLEGFEEQWRPAYWSPLQEARYTNLPAGEYRFHVRAIDATGRRSEATSSPAIVISKPLWGQSWFLLIAGLVAIALMASGVRFFTRERYAQQLEGEVEARIRELRTMQAQKEEESARLRVTLESIGDGVVATDPRGEVVLWNSAAEELTGWSESEAKGRQLAQVLPLLARETQTIDRPQGAMTLMNRRGERLTVEITSAPIRDSLGLVYAFRDITGKRAMEDELAKSQRLRSLGILAGGIAHDFNNLLTIVLGNISLVADQVDPNPPAQKRLRDAHEATLRARSLTQQLLTFSRGGAPLRETASIADIVRDSASFVLSGTKVRCEFDLASDLWMVDIDPGQISQVINNLLINAIQAMPDGGIVRIQGRNRVTTPPGLATGSWVVLEVKDTGSGIAPEHLAQIFDPYFTTKQEGSGLGLATAYSIVRRHDGLLSVESELDVGSVFRIFLPRSISEVRSAEPAEVTPRILVMDDDAEVRTVTAALLDKLGYQVDFAADGNEAINAYRTAMDRARPFHVVIMDLTVRGGMGGREAMHRLLEMDTQARGIVASGYSNDPVMANYAAYGFRARITKPFLVEELQTVLSEVLGRSRQRAEASE